MPRLFERFHRIETARARSTEGSGIGLALVKELVGLHGGTITADSREARAYRAQHSPSGCRSARPTCPPTKWHPRRPRAPIPGVIGRTLRSGSAALAARREAGSIPHRRNGVRRRRWPSPPAETGGNPTRVLLADDNADMREYLTNLLQTSGYQVSGVTDGQQALEAIRVATPRPRHQRRDDAQAGRSAIARGAAQ